MIFGCIESWNYWILIKCIAICNSLCNIYHILPTKKYLYAHKTKLYEHEFDPINVYTYSGIIGEKCIDCFQIMILLSNFSLFFGYYPCFNMLIQWYNHRSLSVLPGYISCYKHGYFRILRFSNIMLALFMPTIHLPLNTLVDKYGILLIQLKTLQVYAETFYGKIKSFEWTKGYSIKIILASHFSIFRGYLIPALISEIVSYVSLIIEALPFLLLLEQTRLIVLLILYTFHFGLMIFMAPLFIFQLTMFACLTSFIKYSDIYTVNQLNDTLNSFDFTQNMLKLVFLTCLLINCLSKDSLIKKTLSKYYTPFFTTMGISDHLCYRLFKGAYSVIDVKNYIEIKDMNGKINTIDFKAFNQILILKFFKVFNESFDYGIPQKFKTRMIKLYKKSTTETIKFTQIQTLCHIKKCVNNLYGLKLKPPYTYQKRKIIILYECSKNNNAKSSPPSFNVYKNI